MGDDRAAVPGDPAAAAGAAKALAEAQKAVFEAERSRAEAQLAAWKARFGEVPSGGYAGSVTLTDKAGVVEAAYLAARAVETAATRIAGELGDGGGAVLLLLAAADAPTFQALGAFRTLVGVASAALAGARERSAAAAAQGTRAVAEATATATAESVPAAAALGLGLDAANKLLGYLRTDYTVGGVDVALDDQLLVLALAGKAAARGWAVRLSVLGPGAFADPAAEIVEPIVDLARRRQEALDRAAGHEAAAGTGGGTSAAHRDAAAALRAAAALADSALARLATPDEKGGVLLAAAAREAAVERALRSGAHLLLARLHRSGGSYYAKRGLLAFLGGMPLFHSGGVVASWVLLDGDGRVAKAGLAPEHGGWVRADAVGRSRSAPRGSGRKAPG